MGWRVLSATTVALAVVLLRRRVPPSPPPNSSNHRRQNAQDPKPYGSDYQMLVLWRDLVALSPGLIFSDEQENTRTERKRSYREESFATVQLNN